MGRDRMRRSNARASGRGTIAANSESISNAGRARKCGNETAIRGGRSLSASARSSAGRSYISERLASPRSEMKPPIAPSCSPPNETTTSGMRASRLVDPAELALFADDQHVVIFEQQRRAEAARRIREHADRDVDAAEIDLLGKIDPRHRLDGEVDRRRLPPRIFSSGGASTIVVKSLAASVNCLVEAAGTKLGSSTAASSDRRACAPAAPSSMRAPSAACRSPCGRTVRHPASRGAGRANGSRRIGSARPSGWRAARSAPP